MGCFDAPGANQEKGNGIDYSRFAGQSAMDVYAQHPNGLPVGWNWDQYMAAQPATTKREAQKLLAFFAGCQGAIERKVFRDWLYL